MVLAQDKTVLVVDDEPNVRTYLAQILRDAGFHVVTASDGDEALAMIRQQQPDFISLDLVMPRKSGRRLLYELRKDRRLAQIPVLIVTAHAQDELGQSDMDDIMQGKVLSGTGVYLEKPVKPLDYVRIVQSALGIEEADHTADRISLKEELEQQIQGAEPHALRRALEILKKRPRPDGHESE
jgi:CheY-like chemotaxis protein